MRLAHAANSASRDAAARAGVPLLDLAHTIRSQPSCLTCMSSDNETAACTTTGDGVHVWEWVGLIYAKLLLSYLCVPDGNGGHRFEPPTVDLKRRFDSWHARCPPLLRGSSSSSSGAARRPENELILLSERAAAEKVAQLRAKRGYREKWIPPALLPNRSCLYDD